LSLGRYIELRTKAMVLNSVGFYDINMAESNPAIFEEFVGDVLENDALPAVIWEPFAGHTGRSKTQDFSQGISLKLVSFDLVPSDDRVVQADSTVTGPGEMVGGVFFHPPYFGTSPLSQDERDISLISKWDEYVEALKKTVNIASLVTVCGGLVCAIGRDYRHGGLRIRLDKEYLKMFESESFELHSVMESEPDVAIIFRKVGL
jgi:hypothetical protein